MRRSGSALLVVLGVLSFLVVSAVSFSAFMRRSRLPSSYLRRTVAARQLARAAVARATHEIDMAIGNGVHPGMGGTPANTWCQRVFFGGAMPDPERSIRSTAPVLTVEGLAYIPPPLVNEARYWARRTPTADWHAFGYDVGRFAYLALDVSDYFDVNRLVADYPRSSAANRRITISHIFEDVNHRSAPSGADKWDDFMDAYRTIDEDTLEIKYDSASKIPLVSVADFNLALASKGPIGQLKSPFKDYLSQGSFYTDNSGAALAKYGEMTFVTDGWFPHATVGGKHDLADGRYQPFPMERLTKSDPLLLSQAIVFYPEQIAPSAEAKTWYNRLSGLGIAALADYLDADRVPISLAVPTTERVPMICGVQPKFTQAPSFSVERSPDKDPSVTRAIDESSRQVEQTVRWKVKVSELAKGFMGGEIKTVVAYPFLHSDGDSNNWTLDGKLSLFFTSGSEIPFRTSESDVLHLSSATLPDSKVDPDTGVINIKLEGGRPTFTAVKSEEDAVSDKVSLRLDGGVEAIGNLANNGNELLSVTYQWTQRKDPSKMGGGDWLPSFETVLANPDNTGYDYAQPRITKAHTALPALKVTSGSIGTCDERFTDAKLLEALAGDSGWSEKVYLNAALWLRIKDADGKVVDMVPASVKDDEFQNSVSDPMRGLLTSGGSVMVDGEAYPVLRFSTGVSFDFGIDGMKSLESSQDPIKLSPSALMVPDPRFNHSPENWFEYTEGEISSAAWLKKNLSEEGDGDIFMATSDAGYLQSIYELAFLPRFTNLETYGTSSGAGNYKVPQRNWNGNGYKTGAADTLNGDLAWYTYSPYSDDRAAFDKLPFTSEGTGMKVNPYSDSTNVLLAAFANTPVDWRRSSTNAMDGAEDYAGMDASAFNSKYAWNEYNENAKIAWSDLHTIAAEFMYGVRSPGGGNWTNVWNSLQWDDSTEGSFLGHQLSDESDDIFSVDRKFFYGFWRDCFAAKQQLFLVFVRAEPLMLGGGTADEMPPQLGARAVALVWRDAAETNLSVAPRGNHRTRLLFYRPLE